MRLLKCQYNEKFGEFPKLYIWSHSTVAIVKRLLKMNCFFIYLMGIVDLKERLERPLLILEEKICG